jgi:two-component system chemotaxis sensor kinase CheA
MVAPEDIQSIAGRDALEVEGRPVSLARLADLLGLPPASRAPPPAGPGGRPASSALAPLPEASSRRPCILLALGPERLAILVDELVDEQEVVLKPHGGLLRRVRNVAGVTILGSGDVCIVLNPHDLLKTAKGQSRPRLAKGAAKAPKRAVLLVEDSMTTRTQLRRILEGAGYAVVACVDGEDGFQKLTKRPAEAPFSAVVSDVEMPRLDGLGLTARIRQDPRFQGLPIVLVTSLASDDDKRRGLEVGANAYLPKPAFDQKLLLETLRRLLA